MPHSRRVSLLLRRAERFLHDARQALEDGYYDMAVFYSEQAAQLALKALMLWMTGSYPEIHGLRELLGVYYRVSGDSEAAELASRMRRLLSMLEKAYTEARYGAEEYGEDEAREAVEAAEAILSLVLRRVKLTDR
jgi:HEPN domain-containing protein